MFKLQKAFIFSACIAASSIAAIPALFQGNEWAYMEHVFMTRVNEEKSSALFKLKKVSIAVTAGLLAATSGHMLHTAALLTDCIDMDTFEMNAGGVIMFPFVIGLSVGHYGGTHMLENNLYKKTMLTFVTHWPENRLATPVELHPYFDELWHNYLTGTLHTTIEEKGVEIVRLMRSLVETHFPEKYVAQKIQISAQSTSVAFKFDLTQLFSAIFSR
ncbi:MAG: hypothetical protein WCE21_02835 [Candidatus Babeliales bacterium]